MPTNYQHEIKAAIDKAKQHVKMGRPKDKVLIEALKKLESFPISETDRQNAKTTLETALGIS